MSDNENTTLENAISENHQKETPQYNAGSIEQRIIDFWKTDNTFEKSIPALSPNIQILLRFCATAFGISKTMHKIPRKNLLSMLIG